MNSRLFIGLAASLLLSACATATATSPTGAPAANVQFRAADFAWSTGKGTGRIDGQLDYKAKGVTFSCTEAGVVLTPETPWVKRRMEILYGSSVYAALPAADVRGRTPPGSAQDYSTYVKRAPCTSAGVFSFAGLPDGAWYAITVVRPTPAGQDIAVMRRVVVAGGKTQKLKM